MLRSGLSARVGDTFERLFGPRAEFEKDRELCLGLRGGFSLVSAGVLAVLAVQSRFPGLVETLYAEGITLWLGRALSGITGVVPFCVGEILGVGLALWLGASMLVVVYHVVRRRRRFLNGLACGILRMCVLSGLALLAFYLSWGMDYARPSLPDRLGWSVPANSGSSQADTDELARLIEELIDATNRNYKLATGSNDLGRPTTLPVPMRELDDRIEQGYQRVTDRLELAPSFARARAPAKPVAGSRLMSHLNISGFYFPYTGEANYNHEIPACGLPATVAHEKAHQRGIASEDEASFVGYLACVYSEDAYVRYSGCRFAQWQLLSALFTRDSERARALLEKQSPGVRRDQEAEGEFWAQFRGILADVSDVVNDAYLRSQGVEGGIDSYAMCARLLVLFARHNDQTCLVTKE